jgi:hypothetical protein
MEFWRQFGMGGGLKNDPVLPTLMNHISVDKGANYDDSQILWQNMLGLNKSILNPFVIGNTVLYNRNSNDQNPLHMLVQNWDPSTEDPAPNAGERAKALRPISSIPGSSNHLFPMVESLIQNK